MAVKRKYVYKLRNHPEQALPPNVESFLVELFHEPRHFSPSNEHEKLQAVDSQQLHVLGPDDGARDGDDNVMLPRNVLKFPIKPKKQ